MRVAALFACLSLGACVPGHLADHIGPREGIVTPQLYRYGYQLAETRCVSTQLAATLQPLQLRLFSRAAGAVTQGYFEPERLTVRDLVHVSGAMGDDGVRDALLAANARCGVAEPAPAPLVTAEATAVPAPRPPSWLNLGAADSGQSIAIDASSIEQAEETRTAWFRLTDPGTSPSPDLFRLIVDCRGQTINAKERKRLNADGSVAESRDYPDNPLPVEKGTVMQIAWMSLCT